MVLLPCRICLIKVMAKLMILGLRGSKWYYLLLPCRPCLIKVLPNWILLGPGWLGQNGITYYVHAMLDQNNAEFDIFGADWFKKVFLPCLPCLIKVMPNLILLGLTGSKWHYFHALTCCIKVMPNLILANPFHCSAWKESAPTFLAGRLLCSAPIGGLVGR